MVITKYRDVRFTLVRLNEIDLDDLQVRIPLGIFINCQSHVNNDLSINLIILETRRV
jgi:hypothetical protein